MFSVIFDVHAKDDKRVSSMVEQVAGRNHLLLDSVSALILPAEKALPRKNPELAERSPR